MSLNAFIHYNAVKIDLAQGMMSAATDGLWQISPLTDLSIPQMILLFLHRWTKLPNTLSEEEIAAQEWHLMHDIEVDDAMLACPLLKLVVAGVDYFAEVRLPMNCSSLLIVMAAKKSTVKTFALMAEVENRFEILFLEERKGCCSKKIWMSNRLRWHIAKSRLSNGYLASTLSAVCSQCETWPNCHWADLAPRWRLWVLKWTWFTRLSKLGWYRHQSSSMVWRWWCR